MKHKHHVALGWAFTDDWIVFGDFIGEKTVFRSEMDPDDPTLRGRTMRRINRLPLRRVWKCTKCGISWER